MLSALVAERQRVFSFHNALIVRHLSSQLRPIILSFLQTRCGPCRVFDFSEPIDPGHSHVAGTDELFESGLGPLVISTQLRSHLIHIKQLLWKSCAMFHPMWAGFTRPAPPWVVPGSPLRSDT